jgi:hypothetical protein
MEGIMGRPRKLPANVIRFPKDAAKRLTRAEPFKFRPGYFYQTIPMDGEWLIFSYCYRSHMQDIFYAGGSYKNGNPKFHYESLQNKLLAGEIKLLSWRLESEWHTGERRERK